MENNKYSYVYKLPENYPEKKSELRASRERIAAATEMFETHFKDNGKPKTPEGKLLYKKYEMGIYRYRLNLLTRIYRKLKYLISRVL